MEYSADPWVQRLRDGVPPATWPVVVAIVLTTIAGVLLLVAEALHPDAVRQIDQARRGFIVLLVPLALVVSGPWAAIATWLAGRHDRTVLARIRSRSEPSFFLPVVTRSVRGPDDLPAPRPTIWTVDHAGLHGWARGRDAPVVEVPWDRVRTIDMATTWVRGQRQEYGIWIETDRGHLVLRPRAALTRASEASQTKRDVLMRVLRSLRRELAPRD
ncbi:hypothetical protein ACLBWP_16495 [Microbacterium sp. M1A1_1b]|uniref:hypothetical protein n=1 Tax=Curtobacterium sp. VKM Ac-2922 TaxID=2929475 RepID=UPI001FB1A398|nr:hypothetical protein [Curtobacterium sp. VKM Ac-2922]MCJ1714452.1 hypothetical protein [Curtobacterium sp. VKM Ac-2922]